MPNPEPKNPDCIRNDRRLLIACAAIIAIFVCVLFFYRGFFDPDEGRYSEIPREMLENGNWLEMRMMGYRYYEKPPFAYWSVAAALKIFGIHDWAARVPLLAAAAAMLCAFFAAMRFEWGRDASAAVLLPVLTCIGFMMGAALLLTDPFMSAWFSMTCLAVYFAFSPGRAGRAKTALLLAAGFCAAMGFLSKGAPAIVLPAAIALLWLLWEKRAKSLFCPAAFAAAALAIVIMAAFLYAIELRNPGFFFHFIIEEHFARFTGSREMQVHAEPFWFYAMVLPMLLLPWTLFIPRAIANARAGHALSDPFSRFLLVWAVTVLVFFSAASGKLMSYIMPGMFPIVALLARWGLFPALRDSRLDRKLWAAGVFGAILTAAAIAAAWALSRLEFGPFKGYRISLESLPALLPVAAGFAVLFMKQTFGPFPRALFLNSCSMLSAALLISPLGGKDFNVLAHINSSHVFKAIARGIEPEDTLVVFWAYRPALPFYTQRLYIPFQVRNELVYGMRLEPERRADVQSVAELAAELEGRRGRVFAVLEPCDYETKFLPLEIPHEPAGFPSDPDTLVFEIFPGRAPAQRSGTNQ